MEEMSDKKYVTTDAEGNVVEHGDVIIDFRGKPWLFAGVSRGPEYNGTAKVWTAEGREFYAHVFNLTVTKL